MGTLEPRLVYAFVDEQEVLELLAHEVLVDLHIDAEENEEIENADMVEVDDEVLITFLVETVDEQEVAEVEVHDEIVARVDVTLLAIDDDEVVELVITIIRLDEDAVANE